MLSFERVLWFHVHWFQTLYSNNSGKNSVCHLTEEQFQKVRMFFSSSKIFMLLDSSWKFNNQGDRILVGENSNYFWNANYWVFDYLTNCYTLKLSISKIKELPTGMKKIKSNSDTCLKDLECWFQTNIFILCVFFFTKVVAFI